MSNFLEQARQRAERQARQHAIRQAHRRQPPDEEAAPFREIRRLYQQQRAQEGTRNEEANQFIAQLLAQGAMGNNDPNSRAARDHTRAVRRILEQIRAQDQNGGEASTAQNESARREQAAVARRAERDRRAELAREQIRLGQLGQQNEFRRRRVVDYLEPDDATPNRRRRAADYLPPDEPQSGAAPEASPGPAPRPIQLRPRTVPQAAEGSRPAPRPIVLRPRRQVEPQAAPEPSTTQNGPENAASSPNQSLLSRTSALYLARDRQISADRARHAPRAQNAPTTRRRRVSDYLQPEEPQPQPPAPPQAFRPMMTREEAEEYFYSNYPWAREMERAGSAGLRTLAIAELRDAGIVPRPPKKDEQEPAVGEKHIYDYIQYDEDEEHYDEETLRRWEAAKKAEQEAAEKAERAAAEARRREAERGWREWQEQQRATVERENQRREEDRVLLERGNALERELQRAYEQIRQDHLNRPNRELSDGSAEARRRMIPNASHGIAVGIANAQAAEREHARRSPEEARQQAAPRAPAPTMQQALEARRAQQERIRRHRFGPNSGNAFQTELARLHQELERIRQENQNLRNHQMLRGYNGMRLGSFTDERTPRIMELLRLMLHTGSRHQFRFQFHDQHTHESMVARAFVPILLRARMMPEGGAARLRDHRQIRRRAAIDLEAKMTRHIWDSRDREAEHVRRVWRMKMKNGEREVDAVKAAVRRMARVSKPKKRWK